MNEKTKDEEEDALNQHTNQNNEEDYATQYAKLKKMTMIIKERMRIF